MKILDEMTIPDDIKYKFMMKLKELLDRIDRMEKKLEEISKALQKTNSIIFGSQKNGEYEFGIIYKLDNLEKQIRWTQRGVWLIVTILVASFIKTLLFGG